MMKICMFSILCFAVIPGFFSFSAAAEKSFPLPLDMPADQVMPLRQLFNETLQKDLETRLFKDKKWKKMIQQKKMTIGLVDFSDINHIAFARVNGNEMMYAASLPKIAVLLSAFHCFEAGTLEQTPQIMEDLNRMIRRSDNQAATRVIEKISLVQIQQILMLKQYEFYDESRGGGLWVGKKYAKTDRRLPEPMKGLSHAATATQVCRFYYQLAAGKLISRERSREMLEIMIDPGIEHKFVKALKILVPDAKIFRKSGTWKSWHSDSVMVWGPEWRRYIAVALVDNQDGEMILRKLIPALESVLKQNMER